jgi:hypothetical protein
LVDFVEEG